MLCPRSQPTTCPARQLPTLVLQALPGLLADGVRRVRVLWSVDEFKADRTRLAMQVTDRDFGKSEILAILTREDLFDTRRPRDESIASFAESLAVAQKERPGNIIGLASRLLESRP